MPARARLLVPEKEPVPVTVAQDGSAGSGALWFQSGLTRPAAATFAAKDSIQITLPGDGGWATFWVAGKRASTGQKDVSVVLTDVSGATIAKTPAMVRVRKDAETLTATEVNNFLSALAQLHDLEHGAFSSKYTKFVRAHGEAFYMGIHHGQPLFLAWHRAFLLDFERELQAFDSRVSLPYWRFDQPAPKMFSPDFMGTVSGGSNSPGGFLVRFDPLNKINGWNMGDGRGALVRVQDANAEVPIPPSRLGGLIQSPLNAVYGGINGSVEQSYHNGAHGYVGGWLGDETSPRDPLFFLLHANVDRAWAHWQAKRVQNDATAASAYSAQGAYPGPAQQVRFRIGSYASDAMWPWSPGANQSTADPLDDWPGFSFDMPAAAPAVAQPAPTPGAMVDYLDAQGRGGALGFCYDDIDFQGKPVSP